jgi:hypothetical protein
MIFGAAIVIYVAFRWDDTSLAQTLALSGFGLIGAVVAAYIGGAAYEDARLFPRANAYPVTSNNDLDASEYMEDANVV